MSWRNMKTIIELYDKEPILNVIASTYIEPYDVIYLGNKDVLAPENQKRILRFFRQRHMDVVAHFIQVDFLNYDEIKKVLREILEKYEDVALDVTGGNSQLAFRLGMFCANANLSVFAYDTAVNAFCWWHEADDKQFPLRYILPPKEFNVEDFLAMSGGALSRHGHFSTKDATKQMLKIVDGVWELMLKNPDTWNKQVGYFQAINTYDGVEINEKLEVRAPKHISLNDGRMATNYDFLMQELVKAGALRYAKFEANYVKFAYANERLQSCLSDVGIWLELYLYKIAKESEAFDDVQISVVVSWNGDKNDKNDGNDTINEIDIILTRNITAYFISCKVGLPNTAAVNEIHTLTKRFGGVRAIPIIVTLTPMSKSSPATYKRAEKLGVKILEHNDLVQGNLIKKLLKF